MGIARLFTEDGIFYATGSRIWVPGEFQKTIFQFNPGFLKMPHSNEDNIERYSAFDKERKYLAMVGKTNETFGVGKIPSFIGIVSRDIDTPESILSEFVEKTKSRLISVETDFIVNLGAYLSGTYALCEKRGFKEIYEEIVRERAGLSGN